VTPLLRAIAALEDDRVKLNLERVWLDLVAANEALARATDVEEWHTLAKLWGMLAGLSEGVSVGGARRLLGEASIALSVALRSLHNLSPSHYVQFLATAQFGDVADSILVTLPGRGQA
jgi:hypothetical protein